MVQWANHSDQNQLQKRILEYSARFDVPFKISAAKAWELFTMRVEGVNRQRSIGFYSTTVFRIAASLVVILQASFTLYFSQNVEVITAQAEFKTVSLPDNSVVTLNAGSSLRYNALTFSFMRKLNFSGEGFFVVKKGSAFTVTSETGSTRVLGTRFNVIARNHTYEVACLEGKVEVKTRTSSVILTPGLKTKSVNGKNLTLQKANEKSIAWQQGEFYFEDAPITEVLQTLELQYAISIEYDGDVNRKYTGYFTNKNLDEALQLVCLPLRLQYKDVSHMKIKISDDLNIK